MLCNLLKQILDRFLYLSISTSVQQDNTRTFHQGWEGGRGHARGVLGTAPGYWEALKVSAVVADPAGVSLCPQPLTFWYSSVSSVFGFLGQIEFDGVYSEQNWHTNLWIWKRCFKIAFEVIAEHQYFTLKGNWSIFCLCSEKARTSFSFTWLL